MAHVNLLFARITPGIFLCVWLGCSVHKANDVIRKIVAQTACESYELAAAVIFVATNCHTVSAWRASLRFSLGARSPAAASRLT